MNSNSPGEHKSFTHIEHRAGMVGREGLVHSIPVLTPEYLLSSWWVPVLTPTYLRPSRAEKVFTTPQSTAENLSNMCFCYSTFEIRGAALLRHRNCATTTIPVCEQKLYPVCFSWQRKSYSIQCEHNLKHSMFFIWPSITYLVMGWIWVANSILGSWWTNLYSVLPILGICTSSPISVAPKS